MSTLVRNLIRTAFYLDSVALMRMSSEVSALNNVDEAVLMIGTDANKSIMRDAALLTDDGQNATSRDLIVAIRAGDEAALAEAFAAASALLDAQRKPAAADHGSVASEIRTLGAGVQQLPDANLALISTPPQFAVREARAALAANLNTLIFSDNISLDDERSLKRDAHDRGLLVMGPDCGTAYIASQPIAFANAIQPGPVGVIAASGTGLQEFAVLMDAAGVGLSHGIGVGGRDLSDAIGAITTLDAIELLDNDTNTDQIVLISKPPGPETAPKIIQRLAAATKPVFACLLGLEPNATDTDIPTFTTLDELAQAVIAHQGKAALAMPEQISAPRRTRGWRIDGLYSGGTLCAEAQVVMQRAGLAVFSNAALNAQAAEQSPGSHRLIDLGADEFTQGRAHPMLDPLVRAEPLAQSLEDPDVAVVLLDVVLGFGAHDDPSKVIVETLQASGGHNPVVIAHVCGTQQDPQGLDAQINALTNAGVVVVRSNARAAELAVECVGA